MEIRNPVFTADGRIDCELEHPRFGWIPFTASESDPEPLGRAVYTSALALAPAPYEPEPEPTPEEMLAAWRGTAFLSRMEFCLAIKRAGILSGPEAVAASKGDMPAIFAAAVEAAEADVDEAAIVWAAARQIERAHPLLELARQHLGWTPEQVDDLFRAAMQIEA